MLSGEDIYKKFKKGDVNVIRYIDLLEYKSIWDVLSKSGKLVILYPGNPPKGEDPNNYGHWIGVRYDKKSDEFYYFDSYGGFIDDAWKYRSKSVRWNHELSEYLNRLLFLSKKVVNYNQYPLQTSDINDTNCGIWVVCFLTFDNLNVDQFAYLWRGTPEYRKKLVESYYKLIPNLN